MKILPLVFLITLLSPSAFANEDLNRATWDQMISSAMKKAKVVSPGSRIIIHGGVNIKTFLDPLKCLDKDERDAPLALYNEFARRLLAWSTKHNASHSVKTTSCGQMAICVKALNGDYLSALFQPSYVEGVPANVTFNFVDSSEFNKK